VVLAYDDAGSSGPPIVLVHGWCCHRGHMGALLRRLSSPHRVLAVDLPGHGETPRAEGPATFETLSAALASFLEEHDLLGAVLVGHSMGGVVSAMTATRAPDRVAAVVNLDGALPLPPAVREAYRALFDDIRAKGFRAAVEPFLRRTFFLPWERGPIADGILADMLAEPEDLAVELLAQFPILDAGPVLSAQRVPVLYVGSAHPRFDEAEAVRLLPELFVARVAAAGHFVQVFATDQVAAMIESFLRDVVDA